METDNYKYHVIMVSTEDHDVHILNTCYQYQEAAEFMNNYIDKNFEIDNYLKVYYNNKNSVSIYKYYMLFPKSCTYKFHIVKYTCLKFECNCCDD
jgi:hypothetical protein